MELFEESYCVSDHPFVRRLGKASCSLQGGIIGELAMLARAGLPIPEGMVITREAHRTFLEASGLLEEILAHAGAEEAQAQILKPHLGHTLSRHVTSLVEGELNRAICEALIELGAPSVAVISEEMRKGDLRSIPEVKEALREAWLSEKGLKRQVRAAALSPEEEVPTWPVLVQREIRPLYTGWSTTGEEEPRPRAEREREAGKERMVALFGVEPAEGAVAGSKGISRLTLDAESVLGEGASIFWGLEGGQWCLLSAVRREQEKPVERRLP